MSTFNDAMANLAKTGYVTIDVNKTALEEALSMLTEQQERDLTAYVLKAQRADWEERERRHGASKARMAS